MEKALGDLPIGPKQGGDRGAHTGQANRPVLRNDWLILLKLRWAMRRRNERYVVQGLVEVDENYVGGEEPGHRGRPGCDSAKKVPVAVALVKRVTGHHLKRFVVKAIAKGSRPRTDGWGAYRVLAKAGYEHEPIVTGSGREGGQYRSV